MMTMTIIDNNHQNNSSSQPKTYHATPNYATAIRFRATKWDVTTRLASDGLYGFLYIQPYITSKPCLWFLSNLYLKCIIDLLTWKSSCFLLKKQILTIASPIEVAPS